MTVRTDPSVEDFASPSTRIATVAGPLLWLGLIGLGGVTAACLLARAWWVFDALTHFRLHYVVLAVLLLAWALAMRRYAAAVVAAVCGAVHAVWLLPLFLTPGAAASDAAGTDVRFATINMHWSNATPEQVIDVLDEYQPDILALQETTPWWPEAPAAVLAAYPYRAPLAWDLGRSVTLISRYPIAAHRMWNGGGLRLQFPVLSVDVNGREITVIAVHPPTPLRPRHVQARRNYLANVVEAIRQTETPVVVLGDFNTTSFSPVFQDWLAQTGLRSASDGFGYNPSWPSRLGGAGIPIDHVLVSQDFAVHALLVGPGTGSDHSPIIADLRLLEAER